MENLSLVEAFGDGNLFYLTYPNREVKASLNHYLLRDLIHSNSSTIVRNRITLYNALKQADFDGGVFQASCRLKL